MERKTITAQEAANYLGVHVDTVYTMVRQRQIPNIRVRRRILFSVETLDYWMKEKEGSSCGE